jgi:type II secretory pathway pseudopilin PulG
MIENRNSSSWLDQALRQAPWRTQTQATSLILALVVIVVVIGALYLAQASRTAAAGRRLQELQAQQQLLEQQNAQLRAENAALQSVPRLISQAGQMGYHAATSDDLEYLPVPGDSPPLAAPTPPPTLSQIVPSYDQTLGSWLADQFAALREPATNFFNSTFGPEKQP